jgi:hypothetical protein
MNTHQNRTAEFDAFVKRQQPDARNGEPVDWNRRREDWLHRLEELYSLVENYLKPYVEGGTISINYRDIAINEENIGEYVTRRMLLDIGKQQVVFTPVGTLLIGTQGRVDVEGAAGKARLILAERARTAPRVTAAELDDWGQKPGDLTWKIATPPPNVSYLELTEETLFSLLMEVTNG